MAHVIGVAGQHPEILAAIGIGQRVRAVSGTTDISPTTGSVVRHLPMVGRCGTQQTICIADGGTECLAWREGTRDDHAARIWQISHRNTGRHRGLGNATVVNVKSLHPHMLARFALCQQQGTALTTRTSHIGPGRIVG